MKRIKILLVEDTSEKAEAIIKVILEVPAVDRNDIDLAVCGVDAKRYMSYKTYDLLLLDVQLPNHADGVIDKDGGYKLWGSVSRSNVYKRPLHIIAITAFRETHRKLATKFKAEAWFLIEYDISSTDWSDQIREKVEHIAASNSQNENNVHASDYPIAVITALEDPELAAVQRLPYGWRKIKSTSQDFTYSEGIFTRSDNSTARIVAASLPQMGMPAATCLALKLIQEFMPNYLIMVGIAAGLRSAHVNLGDVLIADPCWDWGSGKYTVEKGSRVFQPDPRPLRVDEHLVGLCRDLSANTEHLANIREAWPSVKPDSALKVVIGPVATGAAVVADRKWVDNIRKSSRKLVGIEMESYGVYYAAHHAPSPRPMTVSIKSVCDFADADKDDRFQHYAAYTSAQVLRLLIENHIH